MKKRYRVIVIALSLAVVLGGGAIIIKNQTSADGTSLQNEVPSTSSLISPEKKKQYAEEVLSKPVSVIQTKYGDFYHIEVPNEYLSDEVADFDNNEVANSKTKQIILKTFVYEKK
ncbi:hypothetical protein [Paenibacillus sp. FSL R5-0914]|uniref:hypothetical protein n=1 Tax=Paenibacillus sp. FSL R5-0914 TaxID=2921665 RepID=UPI0030FC3A58